MKDTEKMTEGFEFSKMIVTKDQIEVDAQLKQVEITLYLPPTRDGKEDQYRTPWRIYNAV